LLKSEANLHKKDLNNSVRICDKDTTIYRILLFVRRIFASISSNLPQNLTFPPCHSVENLDGKGDFLNRKGGESH